METLGCELLAAPIAYSYLPNQQLESCELCTV